MPPESPDSASDLWFGSDKPLVSGLTVFFRPRAGMKGKTNWIDGVRVGVRPGEPL